jgi:hypothetical protein
VFPPTARKAPREQSDLRLLNRIEDNGGSDNAVGNDVEVDATRLL